MNEIEAATNILVAMINNGMLYKNAPTNGPNTNDDMTAKNDFIVSEVTRAWDSIYQTVKNKGKS